MNPTEGMEDSQRDAFGEGFAFAGDGERRATIAFLLNHAREVDDGNRGFAALVRSLAIRIAKAEHVIAPVDCMGAVFRTEQARQKDAKRIIAEANEDVADCAALLAALDDGSSKTPMEGVLPADWRNMSGDQLNAALDTKGVPKLHAWEPPRPAPAVVAYAMENFKRALAGEMECVRCKRIRAECTCAEGLVVADNDDVPF